MSSAKGVFLADPLTVGDLERTRELLISMDDPRHLAMRRLVGAAFTPAAMHRLTASVRDHARAVVAGVVGRDFDFVADVASEVPLLVLSDLLGVPPEDRGLLLEWSNNLVGFDDQDFGGGDVDRFRSTFPRRMTTRSASRWSAGGAPATTS